MSNFFLAIIAACLLFGGSAVSGFLGWAIAIIGGLLVLGLVLSAFDALLRNFRRWQDKPNAVFRTGRWIEFRDEQDRRDWENRVGRWRNDAS